MYLSQVYSCLYGTVPTHFRSMPKKVFNLLPSSGAFSTGAFWCASAVSLGAGLPGVLESPGVDAIAVLL